MVLLVRSRDVKLLRSHSRKVNSVKCSIPSRSDIPVLDRRHTLTAALSVSDKMPSPLVSALSFTHCLKVSSGKWSVSMGIPASRAVASSGSCGSSDTAFSSASLGVAKDISSSAVLFIVSSVEAVGSSFDSA